MSDTAAIYTVSDDELRTAFNKALKALLEKNTVKRRLVVAGIFEGAILRTIAEREVAAAANARAEALQAKIDSMPAGYLAALKARDETQRQLNRIATELGYAINEPVDLGSVVAALRRQLAAGVAER